MGISEVAKNTQEMFSSSCYELLSALDCSVSIIEGDHVVDAPIAYIDAGSPEMEIHIALELPIAVLSLTYPCEEITRADEAAIEDWASELSNQLIGRLKAKLYPFNINLNLGLPCTYFGPTVDEIAPESDWRDTLFMNVNGQTCAFHVIQEFFKDDIEFVVNASKSEDLMMESEVELF